jgi:3-oxoadipate enol-lactonase
MKKLRVHGFDMAYLDCGRGLPVLLVHGFPLDHSMWSGQIDALSRDYRVIAPDLRGFGQSGLADGDEKIGMDQFADDLMGLLDGLDIREPVVYCGLSMGGYIGFEFYRKFTDRARGLILCDTRAVCDAPEAARGRLEMAERVLREGPAALVDAMIPRLFAPSTAREHPELVASLRQVMMSQSPRGIAAAARGMAERPDSTSALPAIRCPTLAIAGQCDVLSTPAEMRQLASEIPNARFAEIADGGHLSPLERPAEVNAALAEFLSELKKYQAQ